MDISTDMIKDLRAQSGAGIMDCRSVLLQTEGNIEKALEMLREKGLAKAKKKAGRETAEGRIGAYVDADKKVAALVELQCETAPVANNPEFKTLAGKIAKHAARVETSVKINEKNLLRANWIGFNCWSVCTQANCVAAAGNRSEGKIVPSVFGNYLCKRG